MQLLTQISVSQYRAPKLEPATVFLADGGSLLLTFKLLKQKVLMLATEVKSRLN